MAYRLVKEFLFSGGDYHNAVIAVNMDDAKQKSSMNGGSYYIDNQDPELCVIQATQTHGHGTQNWGCEDYYALKLGNMDANQLNAARVAFSKVEPLTGNGKILKWQIIAQIDRAITNL